MPESGLISRTVSIGCASVPQRQYNLQGGQFPHAIYVSFDLFVERGGVLLFYTRYHRLLTIVGNRRDPANWSSIYPIDNNAPEVMDLPELDIIVFQWRPTAGAEPKHTFGIAADPLRLLSRFNLMANAYHPTCSLIASRTALHQNYIDSFPLVRASDIDWEKSPASSAEIYAEIFSIMPRRDCKFN